MRSFTPDGRPARLGGARTWLGVVVCTVVGATLGLASPAAASAPATAAAGDWRDVSNGAYHTCAIKSTGSLWCWGDNAYGPVGDGTGIDRLVPTQVGTAMDWAVVSAGSLHTCGVRTDGSLWCWGENTFGQLGDGTWTERLAPVRVGTGTDWVSVEAGSLHTCGVRTDGSLWCWGDNIFLQGGAPDDVNEVNSPVQVGTDTDWRSVVGGSHRNCATRVEGTLWCWGGDEFGGVGVGNEPPDDPTEIQVVPDPTQVGAGTDWSVVSVGGEHSCGLGVSGALWCWGGGTSGQIGDGATENRWSPVRVGTETSWEQVMAGYRHTCGIKADTTLWCWGDNGAGSLGLNEGDTTNRDQPTQVGAATGWETGWSDIAAGSGSTCGIRDGFLWCWGYNSDGQVGNGTRIDQHVPVQIS
jgi:alpha-tubulin suppressor-like RCC1 family protein